MASGMRRKRAGKGERARARSYWNTVWLAVLWEEKDLSSDKPEGDHGCSFITKRKDMGGGMTKPNDLLEELGVPRLNFLVCSRTVGGAINMIAQKQNRLVGEETPDYCRSVFTATGDKLL